MIVFTLLIASCAPSTETSSGKINITVSILPEKYFVERIGGEHVTVNVMVGPGDSPHTYEPKTDQMTALSKSALYFSIGVEFENAWLERIASANPNLQIIDVSGNIEKIAMSSGHQHDGEAATEEEDNGSDPHVWTSPKNVKLIAQTIYQALADTDPKNLSTYQTNLDAFLLDINDLEAEIQSALSSNRSNKFIVFHPSWGYFAQDFGLEQIAIEIEGSEPSAQELASIIDEAKEENAQVVFAQPEFSTKTAEYIAEEINGQVMLISPLEENWLENLRKVASTFAKVLK